MTRQVLLQAIVLLLIVGCNDKKQDFKTGRIVSVPVEKSQNVDIESVSSRVILLDTAGGMTSAVKSVFLLDSIFYIHHRQTMSRYDMNGNFLGNIGRRGRGGDEYLTLWSCWEQDKFIHLYDLDSKRIFTYNTVTDSLSWKLIENQKKHFQTIIPLGKGYVGKVGYDGTDDCDELGFYDENYIYFREIGPLKLKSGLWLGNPFAFYDGDEILYWRQLENNIYSIHADLTSSIKWKVDFKDKNVPEDQYTDEYDRIDFINKTPDAYATFLSNVLETKDRLYFTFIYQSKKHLAVFNKTTQLTEIHHFTLPENQVLNDVIPLRDCILIITDTLDQNTTIHMLNV